MLVTKICHRIFSIIQGNLRQGVCVFKGVLSKILIIHDPVIVDV